MKSNLSLYSLLLNLVSKAPRQPVVVTEQEDNKKIGTTIRFEPATRKFIETQAEHLGISVQEFVAMTFKAIMSASEEPQSTELELMTDRFIEAFTKHKIPVADIPAMLPQGTMNRSDLLARKELLNKLDESVIQHVAKLFTLNPNWLKGVSKYPVDTPHFRWYKNVSGFAFRLALLNHECSNLRVLFVAEKGLTLEKLLEAKEKEDDVDRVRMGVLIEKNNIVNGVSYKSYDVLEFERWNYWRCRYCLKAMMMFCENAGISYDGILLAGQQIKKLVSGDTIAAEVVDHYREIWYPDQLLWEDNRNTELDELPAIKDYYNESKADQYVVAIRKPYLITDWNDFEKGLIDLSTISEEESA